MSPPGAVEKEGTANPLPASLLVLSPAQPERPGSRLTFVTPTLLAGDRSLTAVVAHEIAHSWSGNLVAGAAGAAAPGNAKSEQCAGFERKGR